VKRRADLDKLVPLGFLMGREEVSHYRKTPPLARDGGASFRKFCFWFDVLKVLVSDGTTTCEKSSFLLAFLFLST